VRAIPFHPVGDGAAATFVGVPDDDVTLTDPNGLKPKYARFVRDGTTVTRESWTGTGKRRVVVDEFADVYQAQRGFDKESRTRMRQGFVYLRDRADTPPGGLVMQCVVPGLGLGYGFDLHPDGTTLATGFGSDRNGTAVMHLVDVATGVRTLVHTDPPVAGRSQPWLYDVLFDSAGGLVSTLNRETRRLDLATGALRVIASSERRTTSWFNPHCVHPAQDAARRRLLVFDADTTVRVLDAGGATVLELPLADHPECRSGALSPSGRLLALAFGATVDVWAVDTGRKLFDAPLPNPFRRSDMGIRLLGFDATETLLTACDAYAEGPVVWRLDTREPRHVRTDPDRAEGICSSFAYSPDGRLLAVDDGRLTFLDTATFDPLPTERHPAYRSKRIVFSADGGLVAIGAERLSVYRAPTAVSR
jgi:WD40 repeat protein